MGHAPLSSQMPSGLDFNAQPVCSQNQWHFEKSPNQWPAPLTRAVQIY